VVFDLYENERQAFLLRVRDLLPEPKVSTAAEAPKGLTGTEQIAENGSTVQEQAPTSMDTSEEVANEVSRGSAVSFHGNSSSSDEDLAKYAERLAKLKKVLSGETPIHLTLQFLYGHNR
jgi:26S proteasome regulatory subunit N2